MASCCICSASLKAKSYSHITILVCPECGHGSIPGNAEENETFETEGYTSWRNENADHLKIVARRKVKFFLKHTNNYVPGKVLEYGCSTGEVLSEFNKIGSECYGVDLSESAIKTASANYPQITFSTNAEFRTSFNAVIAFHVLEHISEIDVFLETIKAQLDDDGLVYLSVPNFRSLSSRVLRNHWPDIMIEHRQYFTPASLKKFLKKHGFAIVCTTTKGTAWHWLGGIKRIIGKNRQPKGITRPPDQKSMQVLRFADKLLRPLLFLEKALGAGSELTVIAKRRTNRSV